MNMPCFFRSPELPFVEARWANDSVACYRPHTHREWSIGAVDAGSSVFFCHGTETRLDTGDVVVVAPERVHSCNPLAGRWSYRMLYLAADWIDLWRHENAGSWREHWPADQRVFRQRATTVAFDALFTRLIGTASRPDKEAALMAFLGDYVFVDLRSAADDGNDPQRQQPLRDIKHWLTMHCADDISLDSLAARAGLSRYHLIRLFSRATGMTPHAFQLDQRMIRARELLAAHGASIADTALQLGFADQSHFQRVFKARVAATPREFQRPAARVKSRQ